MRTPTCPKCCILLRFHPEFSMEYKYRKCSICAYTEKVIQYMEIISLKDYFMGRDITYKEEYTPEIEQNAKALLLLLNQLLTDLNITKVKVSSGWRPSAINNGIPNAAKKSLHMSGKACDIADDSNQTLGKLIYSRPDLLRKYGLFIEDLGSTKGWTHIDCGNRSDRPSRSFIP